MPGSVKNIARTAFHAGIVRHPYSIIPPNQIAFYVAAATLTLGQTITPTSTPALAQRGFGGASSVNLTTTAVGFTSAMTVQVLVEGTDENHDPYSETLSLTGNASALQTVASKGLFSFINRITVVSIVGETSPTAATFSIGIGDGSGTPAIKIPNPVLNARGGTGGEIVGFWVHATTAPITITAAGNANSGRALVVNFTSNANVRLAWPIFGGVGAGSAGAVYDSRTIDNL